MKPEGVGQCPIMFGTNMEAEVVGLHSNYVGLQIASSLFLRKEWGDSLVKEPSDYNIAAYRSSLD